MREKYKETEMLLYTCSKLCKVKVVFYSFQSNFLSGVHLLPLSAYLPQLSIQSGTSSYQVGRLGKAGLPTRISNQDTSQFRPQRSNFSAIPFPEAMATR